MWRLDQRIHAATWDSGEGAFRTGGRWNSKGVRAVYCSLDPATAILEVAVHKGFKTLDTMPYVITAARFADVAEVVTSSNAATRQTPIGCVQGFRARVNRPSATIFFATIASSRFRVRSPRTAGT